MAQRRRNVALGGLSVVLLVVAAYLLVGSFGRGAALPREQLARCVCLACEQQAEVRSGRDDRPPFVCEMCGAPAAYPWLYCHECNQRFVPELARRDGAGPLRFPAVPQCPTCSGSNVGAYLPSVLNEEPAGDAPLPEWSP